MKEWKKTVKVKQELATGAYPHRELALCVKFMPLTLSMIL